MIRLKASIRPIVTLVFFLLLSVTAWAQPKVGITIKAEKEVVVTENGQQIKKTIEAKEILPGEELRYILSFANSGNEVAKDVVINNPIPDGTVYIPGSASEVGDLTFSIDQGKNYKKPALLTYEVTTENGRQEKRVASPEEYTHIRWILPSIAAGEKGEVSFRIKVK